ncbi:lysozyme inhibitor LprI family protein [Lysobacter fragariae]
MKTTFVMSRLSLLLYPAFIVGCASLPTPGQASEVAPLVDEVSESGCPATGDVQVIEACYGKADEVVIGECERTKLFSCRPYKEVYLGEQALLALNRKIVMSSKVQYASYVQGDSSYLADLDAYLKAADKEWREYRDAHCQAEPFVQGMSRIETPGLIEACRAQKTKERIVEVTRLGEVLDVEAGKP